MARLLAGHGLKQYKGRRVYGRTVSQSITSYVRISLYREFGVAWEPEFL